MQLGFLGAWGQCEVLCIRASDTAWLPSPQRLLEHAYLRGRDTLGFSFLNGVDVSLLGTEVSAMTTSGGSASCSRCLLHARAVFRKYLYAP